MVEDLYIEIPEKRLLDNYRKINSPVYVHGKVPPLNGSQLYTIDRNNPTEYNFTDSFIYYMNYNKSKLPFEVDIVKTPAFQIFYIDKTTMPPTNNTIGQTNVLRSMNCIVRVMKLPMAASIDLIKQLNLLTISPVYNQLLTEIANQVKMKGLDKKLYFYKLAAGPTIYNPNTLLPMVNFYMRFVIEMKGF